MDRPLSIFAGAAWMLTTAAVLAAAPLASAESYESEEAAPTAPTIDEIDRPALLEALRAGGHVIYIRHGQTEKDYADQVTADPNDGSTQRVLSEFGWHQSKHIGHAVRALNIPVGDVISSQYFRAWQTADLAFGRYAKDAALNFEPAEEYTDEQFAAMRERVLPLVTKAPPAGVNTFLVGHDDPFEAVTGIYPEPQGVAHVLTPDGEGGFTVQARIASDEWLLLASE